MPSYAFVHVSPDKAGNKQPSLDKHNRGETRPPETMTREEWDHLPAIRIAGHEDRAADVLEEIEKSRGRGRPGCERVRFLFGHPPPFESGDAWDRDRLLSWARDSSAWLEKKISQASGRCAVLERVDLHLDETTPHLHASIVPALLKRLPDRISADFALFAGREVDPGPMKLSWTELQRAMSPGVTRSESMRALQGSYFEDVGRGYGMQRGKSSARTRAEPDRMEGLKTRVRLTEERAARVQRDAQERVNQAKRDADERVERVEQRARQRGRAVAAERDGVKSKVSRVQHDARAARAETWKLRAAARREGRGR